MRAFIDEFKLTAKPTATDSTLVRGQTVRVIVTNADALAMRKDALLRFMAEFFPKTLLDPDKISGLDALVKEAVNLKFIDKPLTEKQLGELIQIPPRK